MNNRENFECRKDAMIKNNEAKYGAEIREKYGDEAVDASYSKIKGLTEAKLKEAEELRKRMEEALAAAFAQGDPAGETAQQACEMHKQWLNIFWPQGMYSKAAHTGLVDMYVADERFKANYEKIAAGCTEFLRDAVYIYCEKQA